MVKVQSLTEFWNLLEQLLLDRISRFIVVIIIIIITKSPAALFCCLFLFFFLILIFWISIFGLNEVSFALLTFISSSILSALYELIHWKFLDKLQVEKERGITVKAQVSNKVMAQMKICLPQTLFKDRILLYYLSQSSWWMVYQHINYLKTFSFDSDGFFSLFPQRNKVSS